ncbi:hypothetical protein ACR6C2_24960 [Streptomyces sp. INA 01156]
MRFPSPGALQITCSTQRTPDAYAGAYAGALHGGARTWARTPPSRTRHPRTEAGRPRQLPPPHPPPPPHDDPPPQDEPPEDESLPQDTPP